MVVTSVTIVPRSPRSDSVRWAQVQCCPVVSPLYEGRESEPGDRKVVDVPPVSTRINFQITQVGEGVYSQSRTWMVGLFSEVPWYRSITNRCGDIPLVYYVPKYLRNSPVKAKVLCM